MNRFLPAIPAALAVLIFGCSRADPAPRASLPPSVAAEAAAAYRTWVLAEADDFLVATEAFAAAVRAGDAETARRLYAPARMHFERIEPIAEALGDFDPRLDAREGDVPAEDWRGYHKLEKLLWSEWDAASGASTAKTLVDDARLLRAQIETADITVAAMLTGAVELLNEVSTSKVTGEEERYSRTDLWDFQANVEGAAKIYGLLSGAAGGVDPGLVAVLDERFAALQSLLDSHRSGDGFKLYDELATGEVKALAAAVDAVAEPLSRLGSAFVGGEGER